MEACTCAVVQYDDIEVHDPSSIVGRRVYVVVVLAHLLVAVVACVVALFLLHSLAPCPPHTLQ